MICIYMHMYTHIYTHIYMNIYIYIIALKSSTYYVAEAQYMKDHFTILFSSLCRSYYGWVEAINAQGYLFLN